MIDLNEDLKPIAEKVLKGDILNIPLLNRADFEKVMFHCVAKLQSLCVLFGTKLDQIDAILDELSEEITEPEPPVKKGKKK